jgi:hypothetical protein
VITDKCPVCKREFEWDERNETYAGTYELEVDVDDYPKPGMPYVTREVTLHLCPDDGGCVAISLADEGVFGCQVYIPSTKEL